MLLSEAQRQTLETDGFITIDTPLTAAEVTAAAKATDAAFGDRPGGFISEDMSHPDLLRVVFHPFIERVACDMLRTDDVILRATAIRKTPPTGEAAVTLEGEHADIRFPLADVDATPRRILCTILIWLTDVTEQRAPFMYRPGSLRQLAAAYTGTAAVDNFSLDRLPALAYADLVPVTAKAGQISVGSTGAIHSGSRNVDTSDRKVIFTQWQARSAPRVPFPETSNAAARRYVEQTLPVLDPSRRYLLDD